MSTEETSAQQQEDGTPGRPSRDRRRGRTLRLAAAGLLAAGTLVTTPLAAQAAAPGPVPQCSSAQLGYHYRAGGAATSHRYGRLVAENTGTTACRTGGYGGVSYVGGGDGTQVGAAATRAPGRVRTAVLQPGQRAVQAVDLTVAQAYPAQVCGPASVDGFRVYPPNSRTSVFVPHRTVGCANPEVQLIEVEPYRRPRA
ncbi:DUF4232 domain-containing protein [Nocardioides nanhaiensis]|uniref:DUF4232 domain-containing protein n=1 Tax=Nocardioides nanhaiensis TaxID=1476871 RepID=A0ABP8WQY0_9ACTN